MNSTKNGRLDYFLFIQIGVFKMSALKLEEEGIDSNLPFINFENQAGDACVILYEDNFWYRARIVNCNSDGYYLVVLIDW